MTKPFPLMLALRFLRGSKTEKNISFMITLCFISIFIGSAALTLVALIMSGFEHATQAKLQSIHADVIMHSSKPLDSIKIGNALDQYFANSITAWAPSSSSQVLIQTQTNATDNSNHQLVLINAIDPLRQPQVSALGSMLVSPRTPTSWSELLAPNGLFIGQALAKQLSLNVGDTCNLYIPANINMQKKSITLDSSNAFIAGIFKTGIEDLDDQVIYCSLDFFSELFDTGITQINIKLSPDAHEKSVISELTRYFGIQTVSWKDLYPALMSALTLEKYVMFIILSLMTLVASINSISLLCMFINHKRSEIAILKAMGASDTFITSVFILVGMIITLSASLAGMLTALGIGYLLQKYPIPLPDAYYITSIPVHFDWFSIGAVMLVIITLSFLASWFPARRTKDIAIAQTLKTGT